MKVKELLLLVGVIWVCSSHVFAQAWTPTSAPNQTWTAIAASADGSKLVATSFSKWSYYSSTNFGSTWVSNSEPQIGPLIGSFYYIAASADGNTLLATTVSSVIYVSTNSGATWLSNSVASVTDWGPVAMSADGKKLVAAAGGNGHPPGFIYVSTNWGVNWNATTAPTNIWTGLASSADGNKLTAVAGADSYRGLIFTSTNAGLTWTPTSAPSNLWESVAASADGNKLVAAYTRETNNALGHIFTSTDAGKTWVSNSVAAGYWNSVALSADGTTLIAGGQSVSNSDLYVSTNFGASGVLLNLANDFAGYLAGVATSADGGKLFAASLGGLIYTAQTTPSPKLQLSTAATNLTLAWTLPSTNFVLQQSADFISWANITNPPTLNLTNLQNEVTLTPSNSSGFFRLKTP